MDFFDFIIQNAKYDLTQDFDKNFRKWLTNLKCVCNYYNYRVKLLLTDSLLSPFIHHNKADIVNWNTKEDNNTKRKKKNLNLVCQK